MVTTQHNAWVHLVATAITISLGIYFQVSAIEWVALVTAISLVWIAEALNTGIEFLADEVTRERKDRIKKAKDVAAFGVLASAIAALTIGALVFLPYLNQP